LNDLKEEVKEVLEALKMLQKELPNFDQHVKKCIDNKKKWAYECYVCCFGEIGKSK
jgi:hypothetical protein